MNGDGLTRLFGFAYGKKVVVRTRRGVEIPLGVAKGWSVQALAATLREIEALPETAGDWTGTPW